MRLSRTLWLVDLQVHTGIVFCADDLEQDSKGTCRLTLTTDDIPHVILIDMKSDKDAALVNRALCLYIFGVIYDRLDYVLNKFLILKRFCHITNEELFDPDRIAGGSEDEKGTKIPRKSGYFLLGCCLLLGELLLSAL
jgi:hypothetical protein